MKQTYLPKVPNNLYGEDLCAVIDKLSSTTNESHNKLYTLISKLLQLDLLEGHAITLNKGYTNEDKETIVIEAKNVIKYVSNKEIVARWLDMLMLVNKKEIINCVPLVRRYYADLYQTTNKADYLIRSLHLVGLAKHTFSEMYVEIFDEGKLAVLQSPPPFLQRRILEELMHLFGATRCQVEFSTFLQKQIAYFRLMKDFEAAKHTLLSLLTIHAINKNEYRIKFGELSELDGDSIAHGQSGDTYYPCISQIYLEGLKAIKPTRGSEDLKKRLQIKAKEAQRIDVEMIQEMGGDILPEIKGSHVEKMINNLNPSSFADVYNILLTLPVLPKAEINAMCAQIQKLERKRRLAKSSAAHIKVNGRSAGMAHEEVIAAQENAVRMICRERILRLILDLKNKLDRYEGFNQGDVARLLVTFGDGAVSESRMELYIKGIYAGFENNFVTSAHILMPQIEESLRLLLIQNGISLEYSETSLSPENSLGYYLEKLRSISTDDVIDELKSFLVDDNNYRFQNQLAHGWMEPKAIQKYGLYLWWICLKLIFSTRELFPRGKG